MKKLCALMLVVVMALGMLPFAVSADETWSWKIEDGVLTITGTGEVGSGSSTPESYPWNNQRAAITEIVVGDGITLVGQRAFVNCTAVTKITYGKDVTELAGMDTMGGCSVLEEVVFGGPISAIGQGSVYGSGAIARITLTGQSKSAFLAVATKNAYNTNYNNAEYTIVGDVVEDPEPTRTWTWTLENGVLTVTGTGEVVQDASGPYVNSFPWTAKAAEVTEVVVSDGITKVGAKAFTQFPNLAKATFGKDVTEIGNDTLSYNDALTTIIFNGPIAVMGQGVVYSCENIASVTITGQTEEEFKTVATEKKYNYTDAEGNPANFANATVTVAEPAPVVDPDTPVAGDATALIAVLAVVALFGAAVVSKKAFVK